MRKVVSTEYEMMLCPLCQTEYAVCDWDEANWWFPHICLDNRSIFTMPKSMATP